MIQATITVVRAIGAEFVRRMFKPFVLIGATTGLILLAIGAWLTTVNVWWWLLEAPIMFAVLLFVAFTLLARSILQRIESPLTRSQRRSVGNFVDKLERSKETIGTPYPLIIFYIIRDMIHPRPNAFIKTIAEDSQTLGPDFVVLRKELSKNQ
jgi:hypothetical protein